MKKVNSIAWLSVLMILILPADAFAQAGLPAVVINSTDGSGETWSLSLQALVLMTTLTVLPSMLLLMTSFTRITIVLGILRTAMGTAQTPSNQVLIGLALFLTLFVMQPVFAEINETAVQPFLAEQIDAQTAIEIAAQPFREFMFKQTRDNDLNLFLNMSNSSPPQDFSDVSYWVLVPAFVTSELKDSIPDRLHAVYSIPYHRPGSSQCVDVDGHDDALAFDHITAVQNYAFCTS